jgi:hypothetical protein
MTRYLFMMLPLLLSFAAVAQTNESKGLYGGLGLAHAQYTTRWYYYRFDGRPGRYNFPVHKLNRTFLTGYIHKKGVFQWSALRADITGEVSIGLGGKTTGEWLPGEETISSGGFSAGLGGAFALAYPIRSPGKVTITPSFGLGPQFLISYCNGKGLGKQFASNAYYAYNEGWTEYVLMLTGTLGCTFSLQGLDLTPSLQFGIIGTSISNWEPNEEGVDMESSPTMLAFCIRVGKKF